MTILFLNFRDDDSTKRLKLAGVRRYAAAAGWNVVPVLHDRSGPKSIPGLLAEHCPVGCIFDADGDPLPIASRHFAGVPVVFANSAKRSFDRFAGRLCIDSEAVVRAAFRELSVGIPPAYAVASFMEPAPWTSRRIALFAALAKKKGRPCFVFQRKRGESTAPRNCRFLTWFAGLPPHTAIYGVNDLTARAVAHAAVKQGSRFPRDFTLVGTDNDPALCESESPLLTSIQIDFERMGYLSAKMLAERMKGRAAREMKGQAEPGMKSRAMREMKGQAEPGMKSRATREMKGQAAPGIKGRASREMKGAACAANGESSSFAPKAHSSFGGSAATLHCGEAAPSFGGSAATLHCGEAAPSLPPQAAPSLHRADGDDSVVSVGPMLVVRRESTLGRGRREPHVLEAVEIIRREACNGLTPAKLAARLPGSRSLLDLRFREAMGHSVMDEILHVRLERVFDLLRRLEMPISAIADFSGFGSLRALDKLFRARFGCSLRAWRKHNAGP